MSSFSQSNKSKDLRRSSPSVNLYVEFTPSERDEWAGLGATVESLMGRLHGQQVAAGAPNIRMDLREIKQLATAGGPEAQRLLSIA